jgi:hypothetical protein
MMAFKQILTFDVNRVLRWDVGRALGWRVPAILLKALAGWVVGGLLLAVLVPWATRRGWHLSEWTPLIVILGSMAICCASDICGMIHRNRTAP